MKISNIQEEPLKTPVFQKEKPKKFRELTFREKRTYIWDYYKWWILAACIIIAVTVTTVPGVIENHKEAVLYAAFINTQIKDQESTDIMDQFVKEKNIDIEGKRILLDTSMIINRDRADNFSMQSSQKFMVLLSQDELDVVLCDDENFQFYAQNGCFQSLEEVLPEHLFEKYKPYMLTCNSKSADQTIYYGISVKTSKVLADEKAYKVDPIFTICTNAKQTENAVKFLEYLMEEEITLDDEQPDTVSGEAAESSLTETNR